MNWKRCPLSKVAPGSPSSIRFAPDESVWHLTLDQIESDTGRIIGKRVSPASQAGNSTFVFDNGNVLYSKLRPYLNKVVCPKQPGIATTELIPLRPIPQILDAQFLTYYLRSKQFLEFASTAVAGVKMPRIIMARFWAHEVPVPPLSEQRRIVEILDQADAVQRKRAEADEKFQRILPALFMKMFGDPATNSLGWRAGTLGDVISETQYGISTKADADKRGTTILRMNNIDVHGWLDLSDLKYVVLDQRARRKYMLEPGDILFNRTNSRELVGKTGLWREKMEAVPASYLIRVRVDREQVTPAFVWAYMNTRFMKQVLFDKARRAIGMANINAKELRSFPMIIPELRLQKVFANRVDEIEGHARALVRARDAQERVLGALIHRAFSGDLTAHWRDAHIDELLLEANEQADALATACVGTSAGRSRLQRAASC